MRFHLGEIPDSPDFIPDESWQLCEDKSLSVWAWQLKALPIAIFNMAIILLAWFLLIDLRSLLQNISFPLPVGIYLPCLIGILAIHELIHAAAHPKAGMSKRTTIGFWPSRMFLYAFYDGELTRERFLVILALPLIILSILPILIASILDINKFILVYITTLNAFLACGDMLAISETLKIPAGAIIRNKKFDTHWKRKE